MAGVAQLRVRPSRDVQLSGRAEGAEDQLHGLRWGHDAHGEAVGHQHGEDLWRHRLLPGGLDGQASR